MKYEREKSKIAYLIISDSYLQIKLDKNIDFN